MTIHDRVKMVRIEVGLTQKEFGERIAVAQGYLTNLETGKREVTEKIIKIICLEFKVDYLWLKTGQGNMFSESDDSLMAAIDKLMRTENEGAKRIFKSFMQLDESQWDALNALINNLSAQKK